MGGAPILISMSHAALGNGRQFENGIVVYNSGGAEVRGVRLPGGPYLDPHTNTTGGTTIDLDAQSGRVVLRHW